jgi:hypothetical protein
MKQRYHQIKRIKITNLPTLIVLPMIPAARVGLLPRLSHDQTRFV